MTTPQELRQAAAQAKEALTAVQAVILTAEDKWDESWPAKIGAALSALSAVLETDSSHLAGGDLQSERKKPDSIVRLDEPYRKALEVVVASGRASVSMVQRKLCIRYSQAQELIARMVRDGYIGLDDAPGLSHLAAPTDEARSGSGVPARPTSPGEGFLCKAWGETDLPEARIVRTREEWEAFVVEAQWGDGVTYNSLNLSDDDRAMVDAQVRYIAHDMADNGEGQINFEIGGVSVERVTFLALAASPLPQEGRTPLGFVKPDNERQVFFYEQDFYVLSNFSAFNLQWNGMTFPTSEHAYHWMKFSRPGDEQHDIRATIRLAPSAHEAFKIAERNKQHRREDWDAVKVEVMLHLLRAKADQHEYVRRKLLATGDRELIEDSWRDDFWGWGPNRDGKNMLGKLWMEVRAELRAIAGTQGEQKP